MESKLSGDASWLVRGGVFFMRVMLYIGLWRSQVDMRGICVDIRPNFVDIFEKMLIYLKKC